MSQDECFYCHNSHVMGHLPCKCACHTRASNSEMTANDMLRHIVASLKGYPNAGGDKEVMAEVERIVREATKK